MHNPFNLIFIKKPRLIEFENAVSAMWANTTISAASYTGRFALVLAPNTVAVIDAQPIAQLMNYSENQLSE